MNVRPLRHGLPVALAVLLAGPAAAGDNPAGKVVADVVPLNNRIHPKAHILGQMQTKVGKPYDEATVQDDVRRLIATKWFAPKIDVETGVKPDGTVVVYLHLTELPSVVQEVVFVGNQHVSRDKLIELTGVRKGGPLHPQFNEAAAGIVEAYYREELGRYFATVKLTEGGALSDTRVVFGIVEGPVVRVSRVAFRGCVQTSPGRLATQVALSAPLGGAFRVMNDKFTPSKLEADKQKLIDYLHKMGHLEARVQEEVIRSADLSGVEIVFHVDEGPVYAVREVRLERGKLSADDLGGPLRILRPERVREQVELKAGGRYDQDTVTLDVKRIESFYGWRGYRVAVDPQWVAVAGRPGFVDVVYTVFEPGPRKGDGGLTRVTGPTPARTGGPSDDSVKAAGQAPDENVIYIGSGINSKEPTRYSWPRSADPLLPRANPSVRRGQLPDDGDRPREFVREPDRIGKILIRGNTVTHQDVILNELNQAGVREGQILQRPALEIAKLNLIRRGVFDTDVPPTVVVQESEFDPVFKDVIVNVTETRTGQFLIGAGINSNSGLNGNVVLNERNFDLLRFPTSWDDFLAGRAFRGRGQEFRLEAQPGTQFQRYSATWREPYLLNSQWGFTASGYYYNRGYAEYNEDRYGGRFTLDRRLDPVWRASLATRIEGVKVKDAPRWAPPSITDFLGTSTVLGLRGGLTRDTRDSFLFPTAGSLLDMGYEQGLGTYTFPVGNLEFTKFLSSEYFQRKDGSGKHVVAVRSSLAVTRENAPVFERFFAGGIRSLRGFSFRGVGPVENELHVGGAFQFVNTLEYQVPLNAKDTLWAVGFVDHGTVERDVAIRNYRVSVGFGFRVSIPALGPMPVAFDFAFPITKAPGDVRQVFAFYVGLFGG